MGLNPGYLLKPFLLNRDAPILWHLQSTQSPWTLPKHITCASSKKKFLEQNCIGIASIICILAWIIFVSFFSKPDRVTFLKRQLYWAEKSWKSRFLGQQPFLCIKVTIISEFLGCGAFILWQESHNIYQVWFVRFSYYQIQ